MRTSSALLFTSALCATAQAAAITFTDATDTAIPGAPALAGNSVSLGDIEGDGDLDIWLFNVGDIDDKMYRNDGTGQFEDITASAEVAGTQGGGPEFDGPFADFDNDGLPDAYVATTTGGNSEINLLYHNFNGTRFIEVGEELGVRDTVDTVSVAWSDANLDGFLDVYVASFPRSGFSNHPFLYMNSDGLGFADVWATSGLDFTGGGGAGRRSGSTGRRTVTRTCSSGRFSISILTTAAIVSTATTARLSSPRP